MAQQFWYHIKKYLESPRKVQASCHGGMGREAELVQGSYSPVEELSHIYTNDCDAQENVISMLGDLPSAVEEKQQRVKASWGHWHRAGEMHL